MGSSKTVDHIIFDEGGTNEVTFYTIACEKIYSKVMTKITAPQSTSNWGSGPKDTKIVDLLRIEIRYAGRGYINSADESKMDNLFKKGGVFNMKYKGVTLTVNMEKLSITNNNTTEQDETDVMFTAILGVNL